MKKTNLLLLLAIGTLGVTALATRITATPSGSAMPSGGDMTTPMGNDVSTNATPDLLKTCPVSGEKLGGDMGQPYVFTYKGQEVKLCCSMCKAKFDKDPDKFIAAIRAADKAK